LKFRRPSTRKKSPKLSVMVGENSPVSDLIKSFQDYDKPMHISDDAKLSPIKKRTERRNDSSKYMTPEGEEMQAIDEHAEEHEEEQVIDEHPEEHEEEQVIDEHPEEHYDFQSSSFGDASPDSTALKNAIYTNIQAPDAGVKN
jgi:hypothetical protein